MAIASAPDPCASGQAVEAHRCALCSGPLRPATVGRTAVEICPACAAAWFAGGKLPEAVRSGPEPMFRLWWTLQENHRPGAGGGDAAPNCPQCAVPLVATHYPVLPGVRFDACTRCQGFWVGSEAINEMAIKMAEATVPPPDAKAPEPEPEPAAPEPPAPGGWVPPRLGGAAVKAGAPCPGCGKRNPEGAEACERCRRPLVGVAVAACPRCHGVVHPVEAEEIEAGACDGCGGAWFEAGRLKAVLFLSTEQQESFIASLRDIPAGQERPARGRVTCPRCRQAMQGVTLGSFSRTPIDTCPGCQASFLDVDRLEGMLLG